MPKGLILKRVGRVADSSVGFLGGVLGGFAGLSGVIPTLWVGLLGWTKERQRGVYQPFCLIMHAITLVWLSWQGLVSADTLERYLWCFPAIIIGSWLGLIIYRKLNEKIFRQLILGLILVSGLALIV